MRSFWCWILWEVSTEEAVVVRTDSVEDQSIHTKYDEKCIQYNASPFIVFNTKILCFVWWSYSFWYTGNIELCVCMFCLLPWLLLSAVSFVSVSFFYCTGEGISRLNIILIVMLIILYCLCHVLFLLFENEGTVSYYLK